MITVRFVRDSDGVARVEAQGHSGLAEHGSDVLCAAVSALVQTAYLAIADIGGADKYEKDDNDGRFCFDITAKSHDADVILRALAVGLKDLQSGYPQNIKTEGL